MFKIFFILLFLFVVGRFFFRFFLPIIKLTRMTHRKVNEMKNAMKREPQMKKPKIEGEYIDYEEVK